jgi:uncharacterized iron-regulated membrane protein
MRRWFLLLHRWIGLGAALVVSFLGITGAALVFRPEIEAKLHPNLLLVEARSQRAPLQPVLEAVQARFPDREVSFLFAAKHERASDEWWLDKGELRVYTDPHSGEILGTRAESEGLFPMLFRAHTELFAGERGEQIAAWSGLVLCSLTLSGLILWLPRNRAGWKRAWAPHWKTNWKGRIYELHRVGGLYLSGFLLMTAITGMALIWHELADEIAAPLGVANVKKVKAGTGKLQSLDELLRRADAAFPEGRLARIAFPAKPGAPLVIRKKLPEELHPNGMNNIALDGATGRVLQVTDSRTVPPGQRLLNLRYPLHIGVWAGDLSRVLAVFVGLSPLLFSISGFLMWNVKRRARHVRKNAPTPEAQTAPALGAPGLCEAAGRCFFVVEREYYAQPARRKIPRAATSFQI